MVPVSTLSTAVRQSNLAKPTWPNCTRMRTKMASLMRIPMLTLPPIMTSVGYFLAAANSSAPRVVSSTQASIITIWSSLRPTKTPEPTLTALRAMVKKLLPSRPTATGYRGTNFTLFTNTNNAYSAAFPQGNAVSAYFA